MTRKTNIFYTFGPDSKFLTFSNYTESMTGNFLSTDTKLFPSKFLCVNLKNFNTSNKEILIQLLMEYYESKLACLRDYVQNKKQTPEHQIYPLNYLLELLFSIRIDSDGNYILNDVSRNLIDEYSQQNILKNGIIEISNGIFPFISDITEQDYNGTYTDTICVIDINNGYKVSNIKLSNDSNTKYCDEFKYNCLYGWEKGTLPEYKRIKNEIEISIDYNIFSLISDGGNKYRLSSYISELELEKCSPNKLEFNCIIPLFDLVDINYKTNNVTLEETIESSINTTISSDSDIDIINSEIENNKINLIDSVSNNLYTKNVPLGIWFADNCTTITIERDSDTGYVPTWSIAIASQFKPFPYSKNIPQETSTNLSSNSFATFSQILCDQNRLSYLFTDLSTQLNNIQTQINDITSQLNHLGTSYTIDGLHKEIINNNKVMTTNFVNFKTEVLSYINLTWTSSL